MRSPRPDSIQQSACRFQPVAFHIQLKGQQHIFKRCQRLNQLVRLEHESNLAPAHCGQFRLGQIVNRRSIQPDLARARRVQARKQAQQSALSAAARAHNGHKLPGRNAQRDPLQNLHPPRAILNPLLHLPNFNHPATSSIAFACSLFRADTLFLWTFAAPFSFHSARAFGRVRRRPRVGPSWSAYGDSITAGYGLQPGQSYPDALQRDLNKLGYHYKVVKHGNQRRHHQRRRRQPALQFCFFIPPSSSSSSAATTACAACPSIKPAATSTLCSRRLKNAHIKVLLAGITLPPNYGPDYIHSFDQVFRDLAAQHHPAFVPMIYKDLINVPDTIQPTASTPPPKAPRSSPTPCFPHSSPC